METHQPIIITIGGSKECEAAPGITPFPSDAFAHISPQFADAGGLPSFVVGLDRDGLIQRVVSQSESERAVVAALVGTWVAMGLRVQYVDGFVALTKLVRKAASAEKEPVAAAVDPAPDGAGAPARSNESAPSDPLIGEH